MKYYCGPTDVFSPEPDGSVYAKSLDDSIEIWAADSYSNDSVTELTKAQADEIKTRPGWEE